MIYTPTIHIGNIEPLTAYQSEKLFRQYGDRQKREDHTYTLAVLKNRTFLGFIYANSIAELKIEYDRLLSGENNG